MMGVNIIHIQIKVKEKLQNFLKPNLIIPYICSEAARNEQNFTGIKAR